MSKNTGYTSHQPDESGLVNWSAPENKIWSELLQKQWRLLKGRACDEYLHGLELLNLPSERIPQLAEINSVLIKATGWQVKQVPSLINFDESVDENFCEISTASLIATAAGISLSNIISAAPSLRIALSTGLILSGT